MTNSENLPKFIDLKEKPTYVGDDSKELLFFSKHENFKMYRAYPSSKRENVLQFILIDTEDSNFINELFKEFPERYISFEDVTNTWGAQLLDDSSNSNMENSLLNYMEKPVTPNQILANNYPNITPFYPNDYLTVPVATPLDYNTYDLNDLKYVNAPIAWGINPNGGSSHVNIGLSDGKVMANDTELDGKVFFPPSGDPYSNLAISACNIVSTHGTSTAATIAAKGNNSYGVTGVCYNCELTAGDYNYDALLELAQTGVDVINMSWAQTMPTDPKSYIETLLGESQNNTIQEVVEDYNVILVASAGNNMYFDTNSPVDDAELIVQYSYPASFENVISVSSVHHWYDINNHPNSPYTTCYQNQQILNLIEDSVGGAIRVDTSPPSQLTYGCGNGQTGLPTQRKTHVFNEYVDILAPAREVLNYVRLKYGFCPGITTKYSSGTSHAAPMVSGTIGLMLSVDDCLNSDEVQDILKLSSKPVEHLSFNSKYIGLMGAGALQTGNAVAFVNEMNKINGTVIIKNQSFYRYDLSAQRIKNELIIEGVEFIGNNKAKFRSGNEIYLLEGTLLEPSTNEGFTLLEVGLIENTICNTSNKSLNSLQKNKNETGLKLENIKIFPTLFDDNLNIVFDENNNEDVINNVKIYDVYGKLVFEKDKLITNQITLFVGSIESGIYILKVYDVKDNVLHTEKIVKK